MRKRCVIDILDREQVVRILLLHNNTHQKTFTKQKHLYIYIYISKSVGDFQMEHLQLPQLVQKQTHQETS